MSWRCARRAEATSLTFRQQFKADKQREIEHDAPKEIDETLPGWGSWSGKGVRKSKKVAPRRQFIKRIPGVEASQRKDAKLDHVILSERRQKAAAKVR